MLGVDAVCASMVVGAISISVAGISALAGPDKNGLVLLQEAPFMAWQSTLFSRLRLGAGRST